MSTTERLDKYLCMSTGMSRSLARRALLALEVTVNGETVRDGSTKVGVNDLVSLRGAPLEMPRPRYLVLHKPANYVCANEDGQYPTVIDLIKEPWRADLHVAGRLDVDTTGLVLLTDDGQWSHRVTSPRHKQGKRYLVTTAEPMQGSYVSSCEQGLMLRGEDKPTLPAQLEIIDTHQAWLTLHEGRYHQVKRMFAAMGNHVTALHRAAIGELVLDASLAPGQYRELTATEVALLGKGKPS